MQGLSEGSLGCLWPLEGFGLWVYFPFWSLEGLGFRFPPVAKLEGVQVWMDVYYCRTYEKAVSGGGEREKEDMC